MIAMTAHCFGALSQFRTIWHYMIGQDLIGYTCRWPGDSAFEIHFSSHAKLWNSQASLGYRCLPSTSTQIAPWYIINWLIVPALIECGHSRYTTNRVLRIAKALNFQHEYFWFGDILSSLQLTDKYWLYAIKRYIYIYTITRPHIARCFLENKE